MSAASHLGNRQARTYRTGQKTLRGEEDFIYPSCISSRSYLPCISCLSDNKRRYRRRFRCLLLTWRNYVPCCTCDCQRYYLPSFGPVLFNQNPLPTIHVAVTGFLTVIDGRFSDNCCTLRMSLSRGCVAGSPRGLTFT